MPSSALSATPAALVLGTYDPHGEGEDPLTFKPHSLQFHGEAAPVEAEMLFAEAF